MDVTAKSRPRLIRTILGAFLFLLVFAIVFSYSIITVTGYEFNFRNGSLQPIGMIRITSIPSGVDVNINSQRLNWWANDRVNVLDGNYDVEVSKKDYLSWRKIVPVQAGSLRWVDVRLVPKLKQIETIKTYIKLETAFASTNRRYLLNKIDLNKFELVDLNNDNPIYTNLNLSDYVLDAAGRNLEFDGYWEDGNWLIFQDQISTGRDLFMINPKVNSETRNLSSEFSALGLQIDRYKPIYDDVNSILILSKTSLYKVKLSAPLSYELVADRVIDFYSPETQTVVYTQSSPVANDYGQKLIIASLADKKNIEFDRSPVGKSIALKVGYNEYGQNQRISYLIGNRLRVFEGSLDNLKLPMPTADNEVMVNSGLADSNQVLDRFRLANPDYLPYYGKIFDSDPISMDNGGSNRLLVLDFGIDTSEVDYNQLSLNLNNFKGLLDQPLLTLQDASVAKESKQVVIDLNYKQEFNTSINLTSGARTVNQAKEKVKWLDDTIAWENVAQVIRIKDYDGQNQHKLIPASSKFDIQLTKNNKYIYYYQPTASASNIELRRLRML